MRSTFLKLCKENDERKMKSWTYWKEMRPIIELENSIWTKADATLVPVFSDEESTKKNNEPVWFLNYRQEVEDRHKDRVNVLKRLLNLIQKLE